MNIDDDCMLCNSGLKSQHHLFFQCPFSFSVWAEVWRRPSNDLIPFTLDDIVVWYIQQSAYYRYELQELGSEKCSSMLLYIYLVDRVESKDFATKGLAKDQLILKTISCVREILSLKRGVVQSQVNSALRSSLSLSDGNFSPS
ncbi:hypothetical protein RHMOL_Rhmol07G0208500 [Rhododendron molle]|uniref:Uncharacterized protein n=1 Tax=Rhododendron molle TaxID=49168 RepID=A0ACC0N4F0_RHOML|nr:hypothetical protein RHMOL_Rhmol07G0208500 [Rhododendron molle]